MNWKNLWNGFKVKFKNDTEFFNFVLFLSPTPIWIITWIATLFLTDDMNPILAIVLLVGYAICSLISGVAIVYGVIAWVSIWNYLKEIEDEGSRARKE